MSTSGQDEPKHQSFYGPASFGGDNIGTINNVLLDAKTKALLAKMAEYAPPLTGLLEKAVRDGVMSPDAVEALTFAARHINEDFAEALYIAGRNINEDVAEQLWEAGHNINHQVADKFSNVNLELSERARELHRTADSLRETLSQINSAPGYRVQPANSAEVATRPSRRTSAERWFILRLISVSLGAGLVTAVTLKNHHLGGYTMAAGLLALSIPALLWINRVWR